MNPIIFITFLALSSIVLCENDSLIERFKDVCEKIDVKRVLKHSHLLDVYMKCLLDESKCTPDGHLIREGISEILETTCGKCSEKQKELVRVIMNHFYTTKRSDFEKLLDEFDPEHKYRTKMISFMHEDGH